MRQLTIFALTLLAASAAAAAPLSVVTVSAPAINCKFDTDCTITVNDMVTNFTLPGTSGTAFLQSRTWPKGQPGTIGAGRFAYLYRLDLRQLTGLTAQPCVSKLSLDFGPVVALDYNGNGTPDQVFVVTGGGLGSVAPSSVDKVGKKITFNFATPVCSGSGPGRGQSSFFFGLASAKPARNVTATVTPTLGAPLSLAARAPQLP